ncbi:DUF302 domain-containing protein [Saccharolobus solfataricus]|uniref:DUF302 domain-containing protein n=3 Tax=Saccharolobus solfataricus TaxID=2287 RepID=Q97ZC7_SACS2|nr:DUF302 domain-containing protein [Saccharolobus solfataricus]AAK41266.1 Conserved hypothetical protein [Saccharolobus solfataricus P2]AKA74218.1 DUF302 domain-containing protein [Saccharolobus solfataricus]AKA76916.1 DUF302 domain-containing protein [Saccharolobus solfataricus]AKA79608.1 DUF302 domain-containing protein [Saccharolobus solfataricus]AZF68699.1 DUF302 domain-containing protein [Saccharolobus solfataricus]
MFNVKECKLGFNECVKTLIERIKSSGAEVFAIIDHSENARKVGLSLEPTIVIYFGNPSVGTLLMLHNRHVAYELPLRFLVWSENNVVKIGYRKPSEVGEEYDIRNKELLDKMDKFVEGLLSNL